MRFSNGRESFVSTCDLAPSPQQHEGQTATYSVSFTLQHELPSTSDFTTSQLFHNSLPSQQQQVDTNPDLVSPESFDFTLPRRSTRVRKPPIGLGQNMYDTQSKSCRCLSPLIIVYLLFILC